MAPFLCLCAEGSPLALARDQHGLVGGVVDHDGQMGDLAAIARERPVPVYFIGVGEKLEELETFNAREFAQALLG